MKRMLNKTLVIASLLLVPAIVAADIDTKVAAATAAAEPVVPVATKPATRWESAKAKVAAGANWTRETRVAKFYTTGSKTAKAGKVAATVAAYGVGAVLATKYLPTWKESGIAGRFALVAASPFWGPYHVVKAGYNKVRNYFSATPKAAAGENTVGVQQDAHCQNWKEECAKQEARKAAKAKKEQEKIEAAVAKAVQAALNAQPKAAVATPAPLHREEKVERASNPQAEFDAYKARGCNQAARNWVRQNMNPNFLVCN